MDLIGNLKFIHLKC